MPVNRVSPNEAHDLIQNEGYTYLDVRSVPEFTAGHPEGAVNVPLMNASPGGGMAPNPEFQQQVEARFPKDAKLVVGCLAGGRSARACDILSGAGYTSLVDQRAGWGGARDAAGRITEPGWEAAGLPTSQG